jgi:hypothetical protein
MLSQVGSDEAAIFGYPRVRSFLNSGPKGPLAICDRRRCERRMAASSRKCRADNFVPPLAQENVLPPVDRETG